MKKNVVKVAFLTCFICGLSCVFMGCNENEPIRLGAVESQEAYDTSKEYMETEDGYVSHLRLPQSATKITYVGNGWYTFEFEEYKFLFGDKRRASVLATIAKVR